MRGLLLIRSTKLVGTDAAMTQYVTVSVFMPRKGERKRDAKAYGPMTAEEADALYHKLHAEPLDKNGQRFIGVCELITPMPAEKCKTYDAATDTCTCMTTRGIQ